MKAFGEEGMGVLWLQRRDGVKLLSLMCNTALSSVHPHAETRDESHCLDTPTEPGMGKLLYKYHAT